MSQNIYTTNYLGQTFFSNVNNDSGNLFANSGFSTVNFSATVDSVRAKKEVVYEMPTIIKTSDITATIDGSPNNGDQLYTFGPYQDPLWLAQSYASSGNTLVYSRDGYNWTGLSTTIFGFGSTVYTHCWNGWIWVAGNSQTNNLAYSFDGITWTGLGSPIFSNTYGCTYIEWNGTLFVAAGTGTGNYLANSYDGINWIGLGSTVFPMNGIAGQCVWNGQVWLASGASSGSRIAYSYDGLTWSGLTANLLATSVISQGWNGHGWLVGGSDSTLSTTLAFSRNPVPTTTTDWIKISPLANATTINGIEWGGPTPGQWNILYSDNNNTSTVSYSDDPTGNRNWYNLRNAVFNTGASFAGTGSCAYWNGSMWMAMGLGKDQTSGDGIVQIANSYDGKTWYPQNTTGVFKSTIFSRGRPGFNSRRPHTIRFHMNRVVATGSGGNSILISSSDLNGWVQPLYGSPFRTAAYTAKFNGTLWVAGGSSFNLSGNTLAYSYNSIRWLGLGVSVFTNDVMGLEWNGKTWLAGGSGGNTIGFSQDGLTWQAVPMNRNPFTGRARTFAYDGVKWVAGGEGGNTLAYTTDPYGKTGWIGLGLNQFTTSCHTIKWNGQIWVSAGVGGNRIAYSYDGLFWTPSASANTLFNSECRSVDWNGYMWVAVGGTTYTSAYSYDGMIWTGGITPSLSGMIYGTSIKWCGTKWFMTGVPALTSGNSLMSSPDGILNWTGNTSATTFTSFGQGLEWTGGKGSVYIQHPVVAGGAVPGNTLAYSPDGIQWRGLGSSVFARSCNGILWNGDKWVATGYPGNVFAGQKGNTLAYSYDGYQWTGLGSNIFTNYGGKLGWNGEIWIATGTGGNSLAYSRDGINWTGLGRTVFTQGTGVAWNGLSWVASGTGGNALAWSSDGITWTGVAGSVGLLGVGSGITSNGSIWVATGNTGGATPMAYSTDISGATGWVVGTGATGIFPTTSTNGANDVTRNGNVFVAVGQGSATIAYSYDGKSWTTAGSSQLTTNGKSVCWTGTRFVATGAGTNQVAYSQNGIVWYNPPRSSNIIYQGNAICSNSPVGTVVVDSAMTLNNNLYPNSQVLEFVADAYYQTGYTNMRCTVVSNNQYL